MTFAHLHVMALAGSLMLAAPVNQAHAVDGVLDQAPCHANCVLIREQAGRLLLFARNADGVVFKSTSIDLPANARRVGWSAPSRSLAVEPEAATSSLPYSGVPVGLTCSTIAGLCTEQATMSYETPTQLVVVTITYYFFDGELMDIEVNEKRIARSKLK